MPFGLSPVMDRRKRLFTFLTGFHLTNRTFIRHDTVFLRPLELELKPMQAPQDTKQKRGMDLDGRHGDWIAPSFRIAAEVTLWPLRASTMILTFTLNPSQAPRKIKTRKE